MDSFGLGQRSVARCCENGSYSLESITRLGIYWPAKLWSAYREELCSTELSKFILTWTLPEFP